MFHKVKTIKAAEDYNLILAFSDGTVKRYDINPLFHIWEVFNDLKTIPGLYEQVKVDAGGYGISWNDVIDLACNEFWENGIELLCKLIMKTADMEPLTFICRSILTIWGRSSASFPNIGTRKWSGSARRMECSI